MSSFNLQVGDTIGVMAPSSFVEKEDVEASKSVLEERGYKVFVHEQTFGRHPSPKGQSAGTTADKVAALHDLYETPDIKVIWAAGGGNRSLYMLDDLDLDLITKNKKPIVGFSDTTPLLNALYAHAGIHCVHGQVFKNLHRSDDLDTTLSVLGGNSASMPLNDADIIRSGKAEGVLVGGCLSLFHYLPGTNDCPPLHNAILFLEDTGDELSRFDRMFAHMKRMGVFEQIGGLVLGEFHDIQDSARPFGFTLKDIVIEALDGRDIPVVMKAPFGHGARLFPLAIGKTATLDTDSSLDF